MLDPKVWTSQSFVDATALLVGERRLYDMTLPANTVVLLTALYWRNPDAVIHNVSVRYNNTGLAVDAAFISRAIAAGGRELFLPEPQIAVPGNSKFQGPLLFNGPCRIRFEDATLAAGGFTPEVSMNWFQAQFGAAASAPIVPAPTTI